MARRLKPGELVKRVTKFLHDANAPRSAEEIATAVKRDKPVVYSLLSDLMKAGSVLKCAEKQDGVTLYELPALAYSDKPVNDKPVKVNKPRMVKVPAEQLKPRMVKVPTEQLERLNDALGFAGARIEHASTRDNGAMLERAVASIPREALRSQVEDFASVLHSIVTNAGSLSDVAALLASLRSSLGDWAIASLVKGSVKSIDMVSAYPVKLAKNATYGKKAQS